MESVAANRSMRKPEPAPTPFVFLGRRFLATSFTTRLHGFLHAAFHDKGVNAVLE